MRFFSVFGPRQKRLLIWELFQQFQSSPEVIVEGTGNESRHYLYIDDLAGKLITVLPPLSEGHTVLNIASGKSVTVKEVVGILKQLLNSSKPVVYQGKVRTGDPIQWQADISRYVSLTGDRMQAHFIGQFEANP